MTAAEPVRAILRLLLVAAFAAAGYLHLTHPQPFLTITPAWVPRPRLVILATGWCEIAGAAGLLVPRLRWWAGALLALYAVCVYPANVKHALDYAHSGGTIGWLYHVPRLLFQPVIVWWCLYAGAVIDWPIRSADRAARAGPPPSTRTG